MVLTSRTLPCVKPRHLRLLAPKTARPFLLLISSKLASNLFWTGLDIKIFYEKPTDYGEISSTWGSVTVRTAHVLVGFDLRTSRRKEHACLARDSILLHLLGYPRPPMSDRRGQATPLVSCLRWFWTTPSVDAWSRRRDVLFLWVALSTWVLIARDQQRSLRGICRWFVPLRKHFLLL